MTSTLLYVNIDNSLVTQLVDTFLCFPNNKSSRFFILFFTSNKFEQ